MLFKGIFTLFFTFLLLVLLLTKDLFVSLPLLFLPIYMLIYTNQKLLKLHNIYNMD